MTILTLAQALNQSLDQALRDSPEVLVMGEDVGRTGGVFRITEGLQERYGRTGSRRITSTSGSAGRRWRPRSSPA